MSPTISGGGSAAAASSLAGFEIGYDQITATVTVVSTTESAGTTVIACAAHTFDGAAVLATFSAPYGDIGSTAGNQLIVCLFEAATEIGRLANLSTVAALAEVGALTGQLRFTPTAASHTYTVSAFMAGAAPAGHVGCGAGGTGANTPAFIRFTKV